MKKPLFITLAIALIFEIALTFLCFFMPTFALELFGMQYNKLTSFLGYIIAWFCLLVSVIIGYAMYLLSKNDGTSKVIIYILGFWWIGLGVGVYFTFGKIDNLLLDSFKGLILVVLNYFKNKQRLAY